MTNTDDSFIPFQNQLLKHEILSSSRSDYTPFLLKIFFPVLTMVLLFCSITGCSDLKKDGITSYQERSKTAVRKKQKDPDHADYMGFFVEDTPKTSGLVEAKGNQTGKFTAGGAIVIHYKNGHVKRYAAKKGGGMTLVDSY